MSDTNERMRILEMIENGQLSVDQGLQMLDSLADAEQPAEVNGASPSNEASVRSDRVSSQLGVQAQQGVGDETLPKSDAEMLHGSRPGIPSMGSEKWHKFWEIPLWVGVAVTVLGGWLMFRALEASGIGVWFICAGMPFALGLAILALAWSSRTAPWLHLRVQQEPGEWPQRIAISLPIPVRTTAWFLRTFGHRIPKLGDTTLDEIILALDESTSPENPIYIEVDEGDGGEKVEIFIG